MTVAKKKQNVAKKKHDYGKPVKNAKKEEFCRLFASDREFMGNGTQSYIESFKPDQNKKNWYNVVRVQAHKLLTNVNINGRIAFLIEAELSDVFVDKQLASLVTQNAELNTKLGAIKEYNALKQRVIKRLDATTGGEPRPLRVRSSPTRRVPITCSSCGDFGWATCGGWPVPPC